ncbi:hypothetical protein [Vibrio sp. MEBiC08052]|uniref:hypothetical protein n=1 Tax=Vibrio sp. MEBiC08052 TaxID=1761910 RepID=UPI00074070CE|nr:hypothetical protein [Vibrio sp. MEBiC08052]KUI99701.1 hypothetical protein VRK_11470 [Vibrio sp. MEBiC08052]
MDKELLARKLYVERVHELMGTHEIDEIVLNAMWESKASPADAARVMLEQQTNVLEAASWLQRYLNRK